jgi:hypothetical protein
MNNRSEVRRQSAEFLNKMVEKIQSKEEPAEADFKTPDTQRIEKITKGLKEKTAKDYSQGSY